jgi:hypothetical protein
LQASMLLGCLCAALESGQVHGNVLQRGDVSTSPDVFRTAARSIHIPVLLNDIILDAQSESVCMNHVSTSSASRRQAVKFTDVASESGLKGNYSLRRCYSLTRPV